MQQNPKSPIRPVHRPINPIAWEYCTGES